jgi:hypothetical protein
MIGWQYFFHINSNLNFHVWIMAGFVSLLNFCCGSYTGYRISCGCGTKEMINRTVNTNPCTNLSQHIIWDGIHYSQRANQLIAKMIIYDPSLIHQFQLGRHALNWRPCTWVRTNSDISEQRHVRCLASVGVCRH